MKFLIKLAAAFLMPNLLLAFLIKSSIDDSALESKIQTASEVDTLYFFAAMIVIIPSCFMAYFMFFEADTVSDSFFFNYLKVTTYCSLIFGIIISFMYLHNCKSLQSDKS